MNIKMEGMEMNVWHKEISKDRIDDFNKKIDLEAFEKHMKWRKKTPTQSIKFYKPSYVIRVRNCMLYGKIR